MLARVSNKGQITLPAAIRRKLGITSDSQVEVTVSEDEIVIRPVKRLSEVAGILHRYARSEAEENYDQIRDRTEQAVAEEVVETHARRVRSGR